ncbi:hypothetical protein D3C76_1718750 [compost metagenome]
MRPVKLGVNGLECLYCTIGVIEFAYLAFLLIQKVDIVVLVHDHAVNLINFRCPHRAIHITST